MSKVKEITGTEFDAFIQASQADDEIAVVDFFATWCGPCKTLLNALEEEVEALEVTGKVRIAKIDVGNEAQLTTKYRIRALPTVLFFRNGEVVYEMRSGVNFNTVKTALTQLTTDIEDEF